MTSRTIDRHNRKNTHRPRLHHPARKALGQNFLVDDNISRKIVSALSLSREDAIIEIGPGTGALTRLLGDTGASVTAVEKDAQLAQDLKAELSAQKYVEIIAADFLEYVLPVVPQRLKVVGNIPYNLTSRIVSRLIDERERIDTVVLMVQDEVAGRLSASPGTKEYGSISIRLQLVSEVEKLFAVPPTCFRPMPRVDSRVVRIVFKNRRPLSDEEGFVRFVKGAFGMRRKMFRHFISHRYGKESVEFIQERFRTGRIETFTPGEIYELFTILERNVQHK